MVKRMFGGEDLRDLSDLLEGKTGRKWGLQQVVCQGAGNGTRGLDLERRVR